MDEKSLHMYNVHTYVHRHVFNTYTSIYICGDLLADIKRMIIYTCVCIYIYIYYNYVHNKHTHVFNLLHVHIYMITPVL